MLEDVYCFQIDDIRDDYPKCYDEISANCQECREKIYKMKGEKL